jgi:GT2 family glycosyltransferase
MNADDGVRSSAVSVELGSGTTFWPGGAQALPAGGRLQVLVRVHGYPIGTFSADAALHGELVELAREFASANLRQELLEHLSGDGTIGGEDLVQLASTLPCRRPLDAHGGPQPFVTVTLPTIGNVASTVETVRRILESSHSNLEVVVVENARRAGGLEEALRVEFPGRPVRYFHEPQPGVSFARNRGAREAHGEIVVFTDDDVIPDPTWIPAVVRTFADHADAACVTGAILPFATETPAQAWLEQYGGYNKGFREQVFDRGENARKTPLYPFDAGQFGSGANMSIRRTALREIGPFAMELGGGTPAWSGEDLEMLGRVVIKGLQLVYQPAALVWHQHPADYGILRKKMYRYGSGLSATVTRWCIRDPSIALAIAVRLPAGARHVFGAGSRKNRGTQSDFPKDLTRRERLGVVVGPVLYVVSVFVMRRRAARRPLV